MTTISPSPFPESGQRKLSARETLQRTKALACTVPKDSKPTCSGQVFVGMFFDGTGNNLEDDFEKPPISVTTIKAVTATSMGVLCMPRCTPSSKLPSRRNGTRNEQRNKHEVRLENARNWAASD